MKSVLTFNYKPKYTHNLKNGEYVLVAVGINDIVHYIVEDVISSEVITVRKVNSDMSFSSEIRTFRGKSIETLISNHVANSLVKAGH